MAGGFLRFDELGDEGTDMVAVLGLMLRPVRAGERGLTWRRRGLAAPETIDVTSPAFEPGGELPRRFAGHGVGYNVSPPLAWRGVPATAAELVLVVEDADAPLPKPVVHWVLTGIRPTTTGLEEGVPHDSRMHVERGSFDRIGYFGPRPVRGHGPHRYVFQVFAVDRPLAVGHPCGLRDVVGAMKGHVVARGRLTGTFERR
jgi:hypothetical protein